MSRLLDGLPWRAAESVVRGARDAWWRWHGWRSQRRAEGGHVSKNPRVRELAALEHSADRGSDDWLIAALRVALPAGAFGMVAELAGGLEARLAGLAEATRREALPLLLEARLATGEPELVAAIVARYRADLEATAAGAAQLAQVEPDAPAPFVLPGRRLHAVAIARAIERGALTGDEVVQLLTRHPAALLASPQLHLLAANAYRATDRAATEAALNRFLRGHGLPSCRIGTGTGNLLGALAFDPPSPAPSGPLVSVIVPAHDAAATIGYAIDSLLGQSYRDLEILVGDDASGDGTLALLRSRYGGDSRVRLFESPRNQGTYNLRNALLARARGELVTFHDSDDLAVPTRIERQVERLRDRGAAATYATFVRVTADGRFLFFRDQAAVRLCMVTLMTTRARLLELGGFRQSRFGADLEVYERLRHHHGAAGADVVRQPLVLGLSSETSLTRRVGSEAREDGYRSPARRAYAELVLRRMLDGDDPAGDAEVDRMLRDSGNHAEPAEVTEVTRPTAPGTR